MHKKFFIVIISVFLIAALMLTACGGGEQAGGNTQGGNNSGQQGGQGGEKKEVRHFKLAHDQQKKTGYGITADIFKNKLEELSGGTMIVDEFPQGQLGQEPVLLQKVRSGDIDFVITATANAASVSPQSGVLSLHYLIKSEEHLKKVVASPEVNEAFINMMEETVEGARVLTLHTLGIRNMYSKFPIRSIDDIKGKKIRVQATKTEDEHFAAYGAQTVHMPFGEVYTSLQTGVMDAAENGISVYLANRHYEVAPVLSLTEHEANNSLLWVSDKLWNSLTDQEKQWVQQAAEEVRNTQPQQALDLEHEALEELKKIGVQVVEDVDKSGFIKVAEPIQDRLAQELGPHAVKILNLVRQIE